MSKTRIVIIDDEVQTLRMLKSFLELFNYEVIGVQSGMEGIEAISTHNPAALILDLMLPDLDGYEICKKLRQESSTKNLPIVILSARSSKEDVKRGYASGATRYLKKPVDLDQLAEEIKTIVAAARHEPPPEARQKQDATRPALGLMHSGAIQGGVSMPIEGDDIDFVIGRKHEQAAAAAARNDTIRLPSLYIKRDGDKESKQEPQS